MTKQFVATCIAAMGTFIPACAQHYTDHLQQNIAGQGTVKITQSKEIDELVNGKTQQEKPAASTTTAKPAAGVQKPAASTVAADNRKTAANSSNPQHKEETHKKQAIDPTKKTEHHESEAKDKEETETPAVDMRKKVMRSSYKVTGYRVQAYAGGNSRADRQKAEQIGNAIKMRYPDQPVYVHFYSPRWICRIGNYRSLSEANVMLAKIRAMGYKQACLVKGKITVQN